MFKTIAVFLSLCTLPLAAQSNSGELRLKIIDPSGIPVRTPVHIVSEANDYQRTLTTSAAGTLDLQRLPYGIYRIEVRRSGFAAASVSVAINSPFPVANTIQLRISKVKQSVTVNASSTMIDPYQLGSVGRIGSALIEDRLRSLFESKHATMRLQADGRNLNNLLNVIDFGGLFSGNAIGPPRSFRLRLTTAF